jgi:hypothetical protein
MTIRANASAPSRVHTCWALITLPMVSQTVLAPAPIRPQKMIQIYCTMVLPIR